MTAQTNAAFVDSSVLVRYLTNDPPALAKRASEIIDSNNLLILSELVLVETCYVLESVYKAPRQELVEAMISLIQRENIVLSRFGKPVVLNAMQMCKQSRRVSFADALLWAEVASSHSRELFTFDERFPSAGISLRN